MYTAFRWVAVVAVFALGPAQTAAARPSPARGVVLINTNLALEGAAAAGTGIVLTKTGEVLTNNHVIAGATTITVTVPTTKKTYSAGVLGYDVEDDVAVLQLQAAGNLATATFGNSAKLRIGQTTRAVGNAEGQGKLVQTTGRVLALDQTISVQEDNGKVTHLAHLIKTSARLVPGDSGGPLLDASGRVIGMDAAGSRGFRFDTSSPGFAIAINHARTIARQIAAQKSSSLVHIGATAFIGLDLLDTPTGVEIGAVLSGSPADQAGLQRGELLNAVDGRPISSTDDLRSLLLSKHPGDTITVGSTDPAGSTSSTTITLADGPPQ